jgi:hypothetical protein
MRRKLRISRHKTDSRDGRIGDYFTLQFETLNFPCLQEIELPLHAASGATHFLLLTSARVV